MIGKNADRIPILLLGGILIFWPFVMFALAFCDDDRALLCRQPLYGYAFFTSFAYPFIFLAAFVIGSELKRKGAKPAVVLAVTCSPLISAYPWLLLFFVYLLV